MIVIVDHQARGVAAAIAAVVVLAILVVVVVAAVVIHLVPIHHHPLLIVIPGVVDLGEDHLVINEITEIEDVIHLLKVIAILGVWIDLQLKKVIRRPSLLLVGVVLDVIDIHVAVPLLVM